LEVLLRRCESGGVRAGVVDWGAYGGEFLEKVMAVLVAQDHPNTIRRTPASGDGGIDLMIPAEDGFIVEQVKSFTDRVGGSEQAQIKKSWATLIKDPRLPASKKRIIEYHLVVPVNPTPGEQAWFDELTAGATYNAHDFNAYWRGETHWNSLAARHMHVIDYYFNGGRDRIEKRAHALVSAAADPTRPLTPIDVAASLELLRSRLSKDDPHYRYEFRTDAIPPTKETVGPCALMRTQGMSDGGFLTIVVVPKHHYSVEDEPINGSLRVEIADPALAASFRDAFDGFMQFGRALDLPDGMVWASLNAPGGLGGTFEAGGGRIGPALVANPPSRWRLAVADDMDNPIAEVRIDTTSVTRGVLGGVELTAAHETGRLEVQMQLHPPADDIDHRLAFSMTVRGLEGQPVAAVASLARLVSSFRPPNELRLLMEYGSQVLARHRFHADESLAPQEFALHLEDLAYIQERASSTIRVPESVDADFAGQLHHFVRLLRGEVITGTWDEATLNIAEGTTREAVAAAFHDDGSFFMEEPEVVRIDEQDIDLGLFTTVLASAVVADVQDDDARTLRIVPGTSKELTQRAGPVNQ
jgi:hypothetical protein